jgi:isoamylase
VTAPTALWPGRPYPLGATWDGEGVNFALFSEHAERVELCLFDPSGEHETARVALRDYTDQVWHGYLPEARPNLLYGYRVHGPWRPREGHRFNPNKLLLDPYAKAIHGSVRWRDMQSAERLSARGERQDLSFDPRDTAPAMPKCRVVDTVFAWADDRRPGLPWGETIIYELHVRGMTMRHPGVAPGERGTLAGLAAPPVIDYLRRLGVTAVELMPVQAFVDDRHLVRHGLVNYWGYNTIGFFAPEPRYLAGGVMAEFKAAVKRLHGAGIEVLLDVVYNHTAEGDHTGPTLSFRGIDNASYYRLDDSDRSLYLDYTGTGNTLNLDHPRVLQLVTDSLRYWVNEMHVDGFRFDLAPALARERGEFRRDGPFLSAIRQDPVLSQVKLVAEPWDLGPDGYRLGNFPPGWAEWNGRYRDTVRRFWKGEDGLAAELASRLAGSSDIFGHDGRRPWSSVNFVTCHDGFTLQDLVSYNEKHNEANGEANRDGTDANYSWNCGSEGPSNDPEIIALRDRQKRNLLATLFLSLGVPMLLMGDELGRSQDGNNNPYCQDGPISWLDWEHIRPEDENLRAFVRFLVHLRRRHRVFARPRFFRGEAVSAEGLKDISWLTPSGREPTADDWNDPSARCLGYVLGGAAGAFYTPGGERDIDRSFLVALNAAAADIAFRIPELPQPMEWAALIDTAEPTGLAEPGRVFSPGTVFPLRARSFALFVDRATGSSMTGGSDETPA